MNLNLQDFLLHQLCFEFSKDSFSDLPKASKLCQQFFGSFSESPQNMNFNKFC